MASRLDSREWEIASKLQDLLDTTPLAQEHIDALHDAIDILNGEDDDEDDDEEDND